MKYLTLIYLLVPLCSCVDSSVFEDQKRAIVGAPNVVYGHIIDKIDLFETYKPYRTRYIFQIDQAVKGNTISDTISLLGYSGKTRNGSRVERSYDYQFEVGDESILMMYPIQKTTDSLEIKIKELCGGTNNANYDLSDQYTVGGEISFRNGKSEYSKSIITYKKMIDLIKNYLENPNKKVPHGRVQI